MSLRVLPVEREVANILDFYVDESCIDLNGRAVLVYGTVTPVRLVEALEAVVKLRRAYRLPPGGEIKWSLQHSDPNEKARIKEAFLSILGRQFTCMLNINGRSDKDEAFASVLRQIHSYARSVNQRFVNIIHDRDAYRDRRLVCDELTKWEDTWCATLAEADSRDSIPIQFADILAGAFSYIIKVAFGAKPKVLHEFDESLGMYTDWPLDRHFLAMLRYSIWGDGPHLEPDAPGYDFEDFMKQALGTGIIVNGSFSQEERDVFAKLARIYVGCMH